MSFKINDTGVKYIKFTTGEEILANVVISDESFTILKDALQFQMVPDGSGRVGVQFIPFPIFTENAGEFCVNTSTILMVVEPTQELMNPYNERYGSGIQVVSPGSLKSLLNG